MSLRIITDNVSAIRALEPRMSDFERSVRLIGGSIRFKSVSPAKLPEPIKNNKRLLRDAQMAQASMSELMAIRRVAAGLRTQFAELDAASAGFNAAVAAIRKALANPPEQKVVSLFKAESALFQKAWQELGMLDLASAAADEAKPLILRALRILDRLDEKIACMLRHHEQVLLDTVIARENITALVDTLAHVRKLVIAPTGRADGADIAIAPTGCGQDSRQTSEATECRSGVPQSSSAAEDKTVCAELGTGRADGADI